jgi:serine/threonine protein kinase
MTPSIGQDLGCDSTGLQVKRPRSSSPTDSKICKIAKPILPEDALPVFQNMYNKATYHKPQIVKLEHLKPVDLLVRKSGTLADQRISGYISGKLIAKGAESEFFPVVSKEVEKYLLGRSIHPFNSTSVPQIAQKVGKIASSCAFAPQEVSPGMKSEAIFKYQLVEHASEGDLRNFLRRKDLSERENNAIPNLGLQLLEKTLILHQDGGAHCDIKPANLLVDKRDGVPELFIGDFGMYTREKLKSGRCGTSGYRGPEASEFFKFFDKEFKNQSVYTPQNYDPKSLDRYAVGVSLFELLTKGSLATAITQWYEANKTMAEETSVYTERDFQVFRQKKIDSFLDLYISSAVEGSLIKIPQFAKVIKGLIQELPKDRIPLEQAIALWKEGLEQIKKDS